MRSEYTDRIIKLLKENAYTKGIDQVFIDFLAMSAISIQNSVNHDDELENQYLNIVGRYSKKELENFVEAFSNVVMGLEEKPDDILGNVFHKLELHNKWKGQFFTPMHICQAMAEMTLGDGESMKKHIEEKGYISVCEPTCGSGAMVIAMSEAMRKNELNPQRQMLAVCTDIDLKCAHMAYIQLSLLGVPAKIIHGNSLTMEQFSVWNTPFLFMNPQMLFHQSSSKPSVEQSEPVDMAVMRHEPRDISFSSGEQISLFDDLFYSQGCDEDRDEDLEI